MNCEEVRRRLLDRALEELPSEQLHPIEDHIRGCAACAQAWEEISATHALLARGLVQTDVPRHFRLVETEARAGWWSRVWAPALRFGLSAGVALFLLVASLALFGASFTRQNGEFRVAFGRESRTAPSVSVSRAEIEQVVETRLSEAERRLARKQEEDLTRLAAGLERTSAQQVRQLGERLQLLQSAQSQMWKETQRSQYLVELVARNVAGQTGQVPK